MDSVTNMYVLLKNLEAFINTVPINPKLPNRREWEKTRAEMKRALKNTYKTLVKQGFLEGRRPCGEIPLKQVYLGPLRMCGKVLLKQVFPDILRMSGKVPLKQVSSAPLRMCGKVLQKSVRAQFEPVRKKG
jgi:hypothetical protein